MSKTTAEILNAAADLLEKPGAWTQDFAARNINGEEARLDSPEACSFCVLGAIERITDIDSPHYYETSSILRDAVGSDVIRWNDAPERTQAEVVAALRAAAKLAEGGEA